MGTGPVGSPSGYSGRGSGGGSDGPQRSGGGFNPMVIIIAIIALIGGGGAGISGLFGGGGSTPTAVQQEYGTGDTGSGTTTASSTGSLNTRVASGAREKYTEIMGNGQDTVTMMVYLCGTDLESKHGMATSDLSEMAAARYGDNLRIIVYTGGCSSWRNSAISSQVNQIYEVKNGGIVCLERDMGTAAMTNPSTLSSFIRYCKENFPANRNELIFWDHGGGSISGYGYDEKNKSSGSMSLSGIKKALTDGGVKFDFIGFDACLMATAENALMLNDFADYLIGSEETEPGVGWYYTNWVTAFGQNTSMPTIELGKKICDDFVAVCNQRCPGQKTTLSVIDLAEFAKTVPSKLTAFSKSISNKIVNKEYKEISEARYNTREFATSSKIDQVDLVHLAQNVGNQEGEELVAVLKEAIKYNTRASMMTNSNGVSIYFPYKRVSNVDKAVNTYKEIGLDDSYSQCIREFAGLETSGQAASGGTGSPFGMLMSGSGSSSSSGSGGMLGGVLNGFLGGDFSMISGLTSGNIGFLSGRSMSDDETVQYLNDNMLNPELLVWTKDGSGNYIMSLPESQWEYVHAIDKNTFLDDGEGFIDMGLDNVFSYDDDGNLVADTEKTWLALNGQEVPYYHLDTTEEGDKYTITGRVPALLNGERVNLIIVFDNDHPKGFVAGAQYDYREGETETVAKNMTELKDGDTLDFLADYYSYDGQYQDSYKVGDQMVVHGDIQVSDVILTADHIKISYRFTDLYNKEYWTEVTE
ncbi:MAG: peptidase C11 [Lachnospiraceae bacterium]|nr:peptidase C11 [Lachnospiraceae bacterium]